MEEKEGNKEKGKKVGSKREEKIEFNICDGIFGTEMSSI